MSPTPSVIRPAAPFRIRGFGFFALVLAVTAMPLACGPADEDDDSKRRDGGYEGDGGNGDGGDTVPAEFLLRGVWKDPSGDLLKVTDSRWETLTSVRTVVKFDNAGRFAIVQNPPNAPSNANQFAKHAWTNLSDDGFHLCIIEYGRATAEEAENSLRRLDPEDLDLEGCGGAPWTRMTKAEADVEIRGRWRDSFGNTFTITGKRWDRLPSGGINATSEEVVAFDDDERWLITERANGSFTRVLWTEVVDDAFHWCPDMPPGGYTSADGAKAAPSLSDRSDLQTGCGGQYPWTELVRVF